MGEQSQGRSPPSGAERLRDEIFRAVASGDEDVLAAMCRDNRDDILEQFKEWQKVPPDVQADHQTIASYAQGLIAVADWFERNGDPRLLQMLQGVNGDNPIRRWQDAFGEVDALKHQGRFDEAIAILERLADEMGKCQGSAVDRNLPAVHGSLGEALFRSGRVDRAYEATRAALQGCEQSGDIDGVLTYCGNLIEICRTRGHEEEANHWRRVLSDRAIRAGKAALMPTGAKRAETSPKEKAITASIVFKDAAGRELTMKDLESASGTVRWEVIGAGAVPPRAAHLHQEGRAAGGRGDYARALELFELARKLAPEWPYPVYDAAYTYLLQGDSVKAEELYREVDRMAPRGFFTAKATLDCLRREREGALPPGFCRAFASVEWIDDKIEKRATLKAILEKFPALPVGWKDLCGLLERDGEQMDAITRGLSYEPDGDTKGMLLINKALILERCGDRESAVMILVELALDPESTLSTEALAKATLARIVRD